MGHQEQGGNVVHFLTLFVGHKLVRTHFCSNYNSIKFPWSEYRGFIIKIKGEMNETSQLSTSDLVGKWLYELYLKLMNNCVR